METKPIAVEPDLGGKSDSRVVLTAAVFRSPSSIHMRFADGAEFVLPIAILQIPLDRIRWETAAASPAGDVMQLTGIRGDAVPIESGLLRYLVDAGYAAEIDAEMEELRLTREEMAQMAAKNPPPPEWLRQPAPDMRRESWK